MLALRPVVVAVAAMVCAALAGCDDDSTPEMAQLDMSAAVAPDAALPLPPECDVFANSGCPAGQRCTIGVDHGLPRDICFPLAAAPLAEDASCAPVPMGDRSGDDCAAGLACIAYAGQGSRCRRTCYVRAQCGAGYACSIRTTTGTFGEVDGGVFDLRGCIADSGCDPVAQDVCTGGTRCYLSLFDDVGRVGVCLSPGSGGPGASCDQIPDCAPGFRCEGLGFCRRYCYFEPGGSVDGGLGGDCPAAEGVCDRFSLSGAKYGVCGAQ